MLTSLEFHNYRCFSSHSLPLKNETIIVGKNNAGKSTLIEGLRLISIITERYKNLSFYDVPDWLPDIPRWHRGVRVKLSGLSLSWENLFYQYKGPPDKGPPARITAKFYNGCRIDAYLGPNEAMHAVLQNHDGNVVRAAGQARALDLPRLSVLPQVMPLSREETIIRPDYVRANMSSYLSPLHFRNQLNLFYDDYFNDFITLVENNWPGLKVLELEGAGGLHTTPLGLLIRDGDFAAEAAWMGHGLQMWLQTMWFLTRTAGQAIIVLDEPDVYMHPDLQRRLIRLLRGRYQQTIIATHSTEILSEAEAGNVVIIDRKQLSSVFTTDLKAVQRVLENIGSAQNLNLTRLWNARKMLLLEGKDLKIIKRFQDLIFPQSEQPLDVIPNMPIGGWSGWPYAIGSAMLLQNAVGEDIKTYCILDSDYYTEEEKKDRMADAAKKAVNLHIWSRKEIENYLVVPSTIQRLISNKIVPPYEVPSIQEIVSAIDEITTSLRDRTTDLIALEILNNNRKLGLPNANKRARENVEQAWSSRKGRIGIVDGKHLLSGLSRWSQEKYNVSFGVTALILEIKKEELDKEVVDVIMAIEKSDIFPY